MKTRDRSVLLRDSTRSSSLSPTLASPFRASPSGKDVHLVVIPNLKVTLVHRVGRFLVAGQDRHKGLVDGVAESCAKSKDDDERSLSLLLRKSLPAWSKSLESKGASARNGETLSVWACVRGRTLTLTRPCTDLASDDDLSLSLTSAHPHMAILCVCLTLISMTETQSLRQASCRPQQGRVQHWRAVRRRTGRRLARAYHARHWCALPSWLPS